jgi:hypothetical protein
LHVIDLRRIHMADERDTEATAPTGGILGLGDAPVSAGADDEVRAIAPDPSERVDESSRRRRADVTEREEALREDPIGGPGPPPGLHVED